MKTRIWIAAALVASTLCAPAWADRDHHGRGHGHKGHGHDEYKELRPVAPVPVYGPRVGGAVLVAPPAVVVQPPPVMIPAPIRVR